LTRIFYKKLESGGLNHRLEEGIGCRLNTDLTGSEIGFVSNFELRISDLSGSGDGQIFIDFVLTDMGSVHIPFDLFVFYKLIKNMLTQGLFHQF
jgi:hypothetical protein